MKLVYYFDVISPYTALATEVLARYKDIWQMDLELKPMFLGGVMQKSKNQPPAMVPSRGQFLAKDLERSAKFYNLPLLDSPGNFFSEVARAIIGVQRILCAAQLEGLDPKTLSALLTAFSQGVHVDASNRTEDNDLKIDDAFLRKCMANAGIDAALAEKLLAASKGADAKKKLQDNTDEAVNLGAYGSPTMIVDGEFYFGSDRFEQMAFMAGKKWLGPDPSRSRL
eukprot:TRINITY_DN17662_c0_g2_i1.p1 TRINITY_DN17662_c0_g2~~TRINITY_DN17662_c0_g2_i1.p1  ORF type:complete len:225 (+),score=69.33 TRINITY_DN17662_c0_g2_i1:141-815(+)